MKKSLFFVAAASALMLTACSSESDVLQTATQPQATVQQKAVGFDVYTPAATSVTRAGLEGTMTTDHMKRTEYEGGGFGVYAFLTQDNDPTAGDATAGTYAPTAAGTPNIPNFMVNEKLLWNDLNQGWYYNPLKYWPNETDNDSQNTNAEMTQIGSTNKHLDRLTFFAYAPYVKAGVASTEGITDLTNKGGYLDTDPEGTSTTTATTDPTIGYQAALDDPNKAVDLLWGVAPAGGLTYTAVNGRTVTVNEGMPLIDMTKPDVNTNMKFLFQHALARIGVTAVAAVDQIGAGGKLDPNTKITIEKITLTGYFGETGDLNLNNTTYGPSVANWISANGKAIKGSNLSEPTDAKSLTKTTLVLAANHTTVADGTIADHLQFIGTPGAETDPVSSSPVAQTNRVGVTTVRQNVIMPAKIDNTPGANRNWITEKKSTAGDLLEYSETTPYYQNKNCTTKGVATVYGLDGTTATSNSYFVYTVDDKGAYTETNDAITLKYPQVNNYYTLEFLEVVDDAVSPSATQITESAAAKMQGYTKLGKVYTPEAVGKAPSKANSYVIKSDANGPIINKAIASYPAGTYYKRDANYFMVVPTNNFKNIESTLDDEKLRTVRVKVWYYITTEDSKLAAGRAQTKNVIEKDVVFPSIANGKSYNLNLVLGLTSVKMEAEVDDWKVVNVNGDLPQNTAN